jgi:hypothetical protein
MGQKEPVSHFNITYQTHMEDVQWSGGNWYGFMTLNWNGFGSDLMIPVKLSVICCQKTSMAWHQLARRSQYHTSTSLIRPTWRIFNGLQATDVISWPWIGSFWGQIWCDSCQTFIRHLLSRKQHSSTLQHHLSDPYMEDIQWSAGNWCHFMTMNWNGLGQIWWFLSNFMSSYINRLEGASIILQHHLSDPDPYGGYSTVWRQLMSFHDHELEVCWVRFDVSVNFLSVICCQKTSMAFYSTIAIANQLSTKHYHFNFINVIL